MATYDPLKNDQHDGDGAIPGYTASQISAAWKLMSRGDKEGLRKRDIERIIRTFRPNTTAAEFEHIVGPLKGRIPFSEVKGILMSDAIPKVRLLVLDVSLLNEGTTQANGIWNRTLTQC